LNSKQGKRSKNEIYFASLCKSKFKKVVTNEQKFNGWDADVIIEDLKIAVLWNGKWHYEKITESHSLRQVQNRDKIKLKEINKAGYTSYVIKDMGKENKAFVEEEFKKFIKYIAEWTGDGSSSVS
jgi:G:T-mismatch repair DNA endonuclease (very short patch repair protein)